MKGKKEMQLHVNYRVYAEHLNTVYMEFQEVEVLKIQSFQQFLNNISPFALSLFNILNFKLPVKISP